MSGGGGRSEEGPCDRVSTSAEVDLSGFMMNKQCSVKVFGQFSIQQ